MAFLDGADSCAGGALGWTSTVATDYDGDGCRDSDAKKPMTMTTAF